MNRKKYTVPKNWKIASKIVKSNMLKDFIKAMPTNSKEWEKLSTNFLKGRSHEKTQKN